MKASIFLLLFACLFYPAKAQKLSSFTKAVFTIGTDTLPYRLMYPQNYDKTKRYPLVLFLHGAGERGKDNELQLAALPAALADSASNQQHPCFILAPQCPKKDVWVGFPDFPKSLQATAEPTPSAKLTLQLLEKLTKQLPVDKHKIYITGYSMGGEGTFDFLTRRPKFFAAAIPICSVSDTSKATLIHKVPVWVFHGDKDNINDVKYSRYMVALLKKHGGKPIYTEYPGMGHNIVRKAYTEPGLFDWLFAQKQ